MLSSEHLEPRMFEDGLARTYALLSGSENCEGNDLEVGEVRLLFIAARYLHSKSMLQPVSIGRFKADHESLARRLMPLVQELERIPSSLLIATSEPSFHAALVKRDLIHPRARTKAHERQLLRFAAAWEAGVLRTPPFRFEKAVLEATESLVDVYETVTGLEPTHSVYTAGPFSGSPRSAFGKFCVAFFGVVDPVISQRTIAGVVRKQLNTRRVQGRCG